MKTKYNRFALIPFHCTECHRIIWLEPYRQADVWTNLPSCCPPSIKEKICNECLNKFNVRYRRMTLDEAIAKYKEITNTDAVCPGHCNIPCEKCVQESEQLAEWLKDYKRIKMLIPTEQALKNEYNKAIDDFAILMKEAFNHDWATTKISEQIIYSRLFDKCNEIAEQLKAGGENEQSI